MNIENESSCINKRKSTCKTDPSVLGFASTKLHQIINEGKEKINENPSSSFDNEGNEIE